MDQRKHLLPYPVMSGHTRHCVAKEGGGNVVSINCSISFSPLVLQTGIVVVVVPGASSVGCRVFGVVIEFSEPARGGVIHHVDPN